MLCRNTYPRAYIEACRREVAAEITAYRDLVDTVTAGAHATESAGKDKAIRAFETFEPVYFNALLLALENRFVHRSRTLERKDGNPLNEVRVLTTSLMSNGGRVGVDKTIKWKPETSVLGLKVGDEIRLTEQDFRRLSDAFFTDLAARFAE